MPDRLQYADKNVLMECFKICTLNYSWSKQCNVTKTVEPYYIINQLKHCLIFSLGTLLQISIVTPVKTITYTLNEQLINMSTDIVTEKLGMHCTIT